MTLSPKVVLDKNSDRSIDVHTGWLTPSAILGWCCDFFLDSLPQGHLQKMMSLVDWTPFTPPSIFRITICWSSIQISKLWLRCANVRYCPISKIVSSPSSYRREATWSSTIQWRVVKVVSVVTISAKKGLKIGREVYQTGNLGGVVSQFNNSLFNYGASNCTLSQ